MMRRLMMVAAASLVATSLVSTQGLAQRGAGAPGRGSLRQGVVPGETPDRVALERRVRQVFANTVRRQLNLDDRQMRSLEQVDRKYDPQRRQLMRDEQGSRRSLRAALDDSTGANDAKISQYLDELTQVMRKRVDILEAEQKELGGFLSPRQRAQYLGLREQVNRRLDQAPGLAGGPRGGGRRGVPPPQER